MKSKLFLSSAALALAALVSCGGNKAGIKVGLICLHNKNSTYDKNFIDAFNAACNEARKDGLVISSSVVTDIPESDKCFEAAERFVKQGYSIIFSDSYGHDPYMRKAAVKYPNVFFSSATGDQAITAKIPNYHNAFASIYEGRYLAGVAAGEYLKQHTEVKSHQLGYVGAFPYAEVISGFTSWYLGVKSVVNDVTMKVTYTNSWYDYDQEAAAAEALIADGCSVISQHADSMGAPNACKAKNIPNISYNINTAATDKTCADTYVAHSRINWQPYYSSVLKTAVGTPIAGEDNYNWNGTLESGSVEYNVTDNTNLISAEAKDRIKAVENQLKAGTLHVFDTSKFKFTGTAPQGETVEKDGENHITKYEVNLKSYKAPTEDKDWVVDLVKEDSTNGTKYIDESAIRSAPSFDLIIDGITVPVEA